MTFKIEDKINETIIKAVKNQDVNILESVLSEDLLFETFLCSGLKFDKAKCLNYFDEEFKMLSETARNARLEDYKGSRRVVFGDGIFAVVLDTEIKDGKITHLSLDPFPSFAPNTFSMCFSYIFNIALNYLDRYFKNKGPYGWAWLQTYPYEIRFQDLCIAYNTHILSITVGLYLPDAKNGNKCFLSQQQLYNMLRESKANNLTPCLFLIDPDGKPHYDGPNLVDSTTFEPIDIDAITDDSNGIMSPWEIKCLGVRRACDYIYGLGAINIHYCDVLTIEPQLQFNLNGEDSYAIVRSVPCGKANEKFFINRNLLATLSGLKGYFIDVRMSSLFGGDGMFNDTELYRGMLAVKRFEGENPVCNIGFNQLELTPIEDAADKYDFIEMVDKDCFNISTGQVPECEQDDMSEA